MNTLLILADQLRADCLGCYGGGARTPHLDRLAVEGVRLERAYTVTSICSPARVSMLTGTYPHRHGVRANTDQSTVWQCSEIPDGTWTCAGDLTAAGVRLGWSGKWHCGERRLPRDLGFAGMQAGGYGNPYALAEYDTYLARHGLTLPHPMLRDLKRVSGGRIPGIADPGMFTIPGVPWTGSLLPGPAAAGEAAFVAASAIDQLREHAATGRPFVQVCSFWGPHHPYHLPEPWASLYRPEDVILPPTWREDLAAKPVFQQRHAQAFYCERLAFGEAEWRRIMARYWGYISWIDHEIGRLLAELDRLGLAGSTAVLFTADHGDMNGAHGGIWDKGEYMYEDTYRIPLLARVPGMPCGASSRGFAMNMDLAPTLLDLAGLPVPNGLDGVSLLPLLRTPAIPAGWRDDLMAECQGLRVAYPQRLLRWGDWKLVHNLSDRDELYDLAGDPQELVNRIDHPACAAVRLEGRERLRRRMREGQDPFLGSAWQLQAHFG